jgi:serine/threonine-protein kinase
MQVQFRPVPPNERRFGRYTLLYRIASGGMASLYLAHYAGPDGFEKFVAIKRIHQHLAENTEFCKMFVDEARLAARISHPNVAQVIELGAVDGSYFIAMEYVDGESLNAILRRTRIPIEIGVRVLSHAAQGLHAAHELRSIEGSLLHVVHRDVSPSNLMISYDGVMKIVDFGVAKARGNTHTTGVETIKGKFAYIAPEQIRAEIDGEGPVDRRADIFALGIVLYEVTTWRRLFRAENDQDSADMVLKMPIAPPSVVDSDYPPELEQIVMRALQRKRSERYQTAHELHLDLEAYLASIGQTVLQSTVGELMQRTFPDAIAERAELMKSCRQIIDSTPPALTDEPSSPTVAGAVGELAEGASIHLQRRSLWPVWLAAGLLLVGAGVLFVMLQRPPRVVSARAAEDTVQVELRTSPADAQIELDGKPSTNPLLVRRRKGAAALKVRISAPNHVARELELGFGESKSWMIALDRVPEPKPASQPVVADLDPAKGKKTLKVRVPKQKKKDEKKTGPGEKKTGVVKDLFKNPYGT